MRTPPSYAMFQEFYSSSDDQKLDELVDTCQLIATVLEFQQQVHFHKYNCLV